MDFPWISDVSGNRKHAGYLPKTTGPSVVGRDFDTSAVHHHHHHHPSSSSSSSSTTPTTTTTSTAATARRPRAGTMPSSVFSYTPMTTMPLSLPPLHGNPSTTRHRSGSVTLAFERNNGNGVGVGGTTVSGGTDLLGDGSSSSSMAPPATTTTTEAAAMNYDIQQPHQADSTIASTLASLGLDDDQPGSFTGNNGTRGEDDIGINNSNGRTRSRGYSTLPALSITPESSNHHHPSVMAASSSAGRTRAYTVGPERPNISRLLAPTATTAMRFDPFENDAAASSSPFAQPPSQPPLASFQKPSNQHHQSLVANRPRAVSLGVANHHGPPPPSTQELLSLGGRPYHHPHNTSTTSTAGSPLRSSRSSTNLMMMMMTADQNEEQLNEHSGGAGTSTCSSPSSAAAQIPSRALWLGNITPSLSVADLMQIFSCYGHVESARILSDKECAFVNFTNVDSAVAAKNDLETRLDSKLQGATVRVGYGKADVTQAMANTTEAGPNAQGPTRALWVGNIPANMNPSILQAIFQSFGPIESVRVLSHKNCGFVNFEQQQDAVLARKALQNKEILGPGTGAVRIGFAKVPEEGDIKPGNNNNNNTTAAAMSSLGNNNNNGAAAMAPITSPDTYQATQWAAAMMMSSMMKGQHHPLLAQQQQQQQPVTSLYAAIKTERRFIMQQLDSTLDLAEDGETTLPMTYLSSIPLVPELGADRKLEPLRLRDMRKRLDNGNMSMLDIEAMVFECMDEIVELCNDYIGNTVIQKLYEYGNEQTKLMMLERIAPYLASIGVHKNGTWAAQKIIDHSNTPPLIKLISIHIAPYVPLLLLDQYGNYVVQGCLRKSKGVTADDDEISSDYIIDAIADKCWEIGQGRFGARAVRAILETTPVITHEQQCYVAAAIIQNAVLLTTNANGVLLLVWLLDTSELPGRYSALCPRLLPYLGKLCTHKLGAMTILKILNQRHDADARQVLLNAIFHDANLLGDVLRDQVHGLGLVQKVLAMPDLDRREVIVRRVRDALMDRAHVQTYKRLLDELDNSLQQQDTTQSSSPSSQQQEQDKQQQTPDASVNDGGAAEDVHAWAKNPQAVAMMANMYAAAMATAATNLQQEQPQQPSSSSSSPSNVPNMPDLSQFDQLIKALLRNNEA
ncbi:pumilio rrm domain-containing protein [Lichtheimia corymbifera JMRC:FSU:9682]|uniref:Pumilio rrm domain-containing protein n=1 Tax=Lichtheimia corymbifera JMRC:FSU:9682 TaxID=1263082 RepID=A0A068RXN9_9FUNG|nr:pumilio rrm domain-containing protein [Lichtheimia corymbifera JMRC:FSU:9682]